MKRKLLLLSFVALVACFVSFSNNSTSFAQMDPFDPADPFDGEGLPGIGLSCEDQYWRNFLSCDSRVTSALSRWQNSGSSSSTCTTQCNDANRCAQRCEADCNTNYPNDPAGRSQCISTCQSSCPNPDNCRQNCINANYTRFVSSYSCYNSIPACQPQLDECGFARFQRDQCLVLFPLDPNNPLVNAEERMDCMLASGISMCE